MNKYFSFRAYTVFFFTAIWLSLKRQAKMQSCPLVWRTILI